MRTISAAMFLVVFCFGCFGGEALVVIGPWAGAEADQFVPVLEEFGRRTGIPVEYRIMRAEDLAMVLPAQFAAGLTPGDLIFMWGWWIEENAHHLIDLSEEAKDVPFTAEPIVVEGKAVGLPYVIWVKPGFWYRKSFFEAHGLREPKTWADFYGLLARIQAIPGIEKAVVSGNGVGWPLSDVTEHFILAVGGLEMQLGLIDGTVRFQDPEVRAVFENFLLPFLKYASEPIEWTAAIDLWWEGKYGLYFMGQWITGMVPDPEDLGVFTLPGAGAVVGGTDYMMVPKYSTKIDQARELVAFLVSKEGVELRASLGGKLSMRADVGPEAHPPIEQVLYTAIQGLAVAPDLDDTVGGEWQLGFWDQLKLLWVRPEALDQVLRTLDELHPAR